MNRIRKAIVGLTIAGAALTPVVAAAGPAAATGGQDGLVNVYVTNLLNGNDVAILQNVSVPVAAALCNINANVLSSQLLNNQKGDCPALTSLKQIAWVG